MININETLLNFKGLIESAIVQGGDEGKTSLIRTSILINLIHDAVKQEFINLGINPDNIYPPYVFVSHTFWLYKLTI